MIRKLIFKRLRILYCIGMLCILCNCKSSKVTEEQKYTADINYLEMLMEKETYYLDIEVAFPFNTAATQQVANALFLSRTGNSANRVDISGDGHFIEIQTDSVKGDLPFFGERRLNAGNYGGTNSGIAFNGIKKNYQKTINKEKRKIEIKFKTNQNGEPSESYDVSLEIFPNKSAVVNITPNFKTFMRYTGTLKPEKDSQ